MRLLILRCVRHTVAGGEKLTPTPTKKTELKKLDDPMVEARVTRW